MIPLSIPNIDGNEWKYVKDCLDTGWISSAGDYVNKFEQSIAKYKNEAIYQMKKYNMVYFYINEDYLALRLSLL